MHTEHARIYTNSNSEATLASKQPCTANENKFDLFFRSDTVLYTAAHSFDAYCSRYAVTARGVRATSGKLSKEAQSNARWERLASDSRVQR